MRCVLAVAAALAAGCTTAPPVVDGTGAITCVRVDTLTTQTTTVYVAPGQAGAVSVLPDCTVQARFDGPAP